MKSKSVLSMEVVPNEMLVDKVLKIILKSKKDLKIESIQFLNRSILMSLSAFNASTINFLEDDLDFSNLGALRLFGSNGNFSAIAKLPWKINKSSISIINPETFFELINTGKNVNTVISKDEIVMEGSTSDIISIFLQLANTKILHANEILINSIDTNYLMLVLKLSDKL